MGFSNLKKSIFHQKKIGLNFSSRHFHISARILRNKSSDKIILLIRVCTNGNIVNQRPHIAVMFLSRFCFDENSIYFLRALRTHMSELLV